MASPTIAPLLQGGRTGTLPGARAARRSESSLADAYGRRGLILRSGGIWALAFLVLLWGVARPAWSGDEAATVIVVRRPLAGVLRTFAFDPAVAPYYLLSKLWSIVSTSEFWLRLPSVLAMATSVLLFWLLSSRFVGRAASCLGTLFLLMLPATSRYGQDARPYALSLMLVLLTVLCWADDRLVASRRRQAMLAGLLVLVGLAHLYALLITPVLVVVSALSPRADRTREVRTVLGSSAAALLVSLPFAVVVGQRAHGQGDPPPVTPANVAEELLRLPVGVLSPHLAVPLALTAIAVALGGIVLGYRRTGPARRAAVLATVWLGLPVVALCGFQAVSDSPGLVTRYWLFCLPALALGAGLVVDALGRRHLPVAIGGIALIVLLGVPAQVAIRGENGHLGQRWRDLHLVLALPALTDAAVLAEGWTYRGVLSNDPSIGSRMPLVIDPAPTGRVNPMIAGADSDAFRTLVRDHDTVVALQAERGASTAMPTRRSFSAFREELRAYETPMVLCVYFGEPLGVFTQKSTSLPIEVRRQLATSIAAIQPDHIRCTWTGER